MGKVSRRRDRQRRQGIIDDDEIFERMEKGRRLDILFTKLFLVMMFSILLMYIPWLSNYGTKDKELQRYRKSFEQQVEERMSNYLF